MSEIADPSEVFEMQLASQGVGCIQVKDGHIFQFTRDLLISLLERADASETGRVVLFIKHGVQA